MKKTIRFIVVLVIFAVIFISAALAIPFNRGVSFWIAFAFELIAIILQYPVLCSVFKDDTPKDVFYGLPIVRKSLCYLSVQTVLSALLFILGYIPGFPTWIAFISCILVIGISSLKIFIADTAKQKIQSIDTKTEAATALMESMRFKASVLVDMVGDGEIKKLLNSLSEDFRYSDPLSIPKTESMELELSSLLEELQQHISDNTITSEEINFVQNKLSQRNRLHKS